MPSNLGPDDYHIIMRFGGGLSTRPSEMDINEREAADGNNFLLDLENRELRRRPPFDLVATAPNAESINGGGSLLKSDGTVKAFIQAGDTVYDFDGESFQNSPVLDTVSSSAKLRAHYHSNAWTLDDKILITDLGLVEVVKEWDGTTWQDVSFLSNPSMSFGAFYAKYMHISNERAIFAHVRDAGATTRHMIVGSKRGDYTTLSVDDRPSSALNEEDPFFLLAPDLKPINGMVEAFGTIIISTEQGQLYNLSGASAKDFAFENFYPGSAAIGEESMTYVGNDIVYGRRGRLESVRDTDRFGDSEADDLSRLIADSVEGYTGWNTVFNSRLNRVYHFPENQSEVWVYQTAMRDGQVSPWMRWVTEHPLAFQPTFVEALLDPSDGLEYVFMGDSSGNLYRMEGTGSNGDGGTDNIQVEFLSKMVQIDLPPDQEIFDIEGYIKYRKDQAFTVELIFEYAGISIYNQSITIEAPAASGGTYYAGDGYYGGEFYYSSISGRLSRQRFVVPGQSTEFQVRIKVNGANDFSISEIGLAFLASRT